MKEKQKNNKTLRVHALFPAIFLKTAPPIGAY